MSDTPALLEILNPAYAPLCARAGRQRYGQWTGKADGRVGERIEKVVPTVAPQIPRIPLHPDLLVR